MPKTRELLYLSFTEEENKVLSYGIEFNEFVNCLGFRPKNILILEGDYWGSQFDFTTRCHICNENEIDEFIAEEVYNYGDFCWIDFEDINELKSMTRTEAAELIYLGKLQQPVGTPFFKKLGNRFVYLAHDDGWRNMIYYRDLQEYREILNRLIVHKIHKVHGKRVNSLSNDIIEELVELSKFGLAIDFDRLLEDIDEGSFELSMYGLGSMTDMDAMYENYERYKAKASHNKSLEYVNDEWFLRDWSKEL